MALPKHYMTEAGRQAIIEACRPMRDRLAELRAQRPFRDFDRKVVNRAAYRNPLLQVRS